MKNFLFFVAILTLSAAQALDVNRVYLDEDGHFDIDPIIVDLCVKHNINRDDLIIGAFGRHDIPAEVIDKLLDGKSIGGYCNVCGGEV